MRTSKYNGGCPVWTSEDWEYMNDSIEVDTTFSPYPVWIDQQVKVKAKKVVAKKLERTEEQEKKYQQEKIIRAKLAYQKEQRDKAALEERKEDDRVWFWTHLANILGQLGVTVSPIDNEKYYAASSSGQVCMVVRDVTDDKKHPYDAAKKTAEKIVLFFAQQLLTKVNDEK